MIRITERQRKVLKIIHEHVEASTMPPTIREIAEALGVRSTNGVSDHLRALESKGYLERLATKSRGLVVTAAGRTELGLDDDGARPVGAAAMMRVDDALVRIPLLGRIAAGSPIEAIENADEEVALDPAMFRRSVSASQTIALRVQGDSMTGDGIFDGDTIFVERTATVARSAIAAVIVDGEATVKRMAQRDGKLVLESSNPDYAPIEIPADGSRRVTVLGRVVGVFRALP